MVADRELVRALGPGTVLHVGSSGDKPRKPEHDHHLPPVDSPENMEYRLRQRRQEAFGGWPIWIVAALLVLVLVGWLVVTL